MCVCVFIYIQLMIPAWVWIVTGMLFVIPFGDVYVRMVSKAMELVVRVSNSFNTHWSKSSHQMTKLFKGEWYEITNWHSSYQHLTSFCTSFCTHFDGKFRLRIVRAELNIVHVIYQTRESVFRRDIQTPRRELKIRRAAEYFWWNSRCLDSRCLECLIYLLNRNKN